MPVGRETEHDAELAVCLFEDASTAVRNASMRRALDLGVDSNDIRSLEDLVGHLSRVPDDGWEGKPASERPTTLPGVERRRRRIRRREVRAAR